MTNKKFPPPFEVRCNVWQPYWIEGKILINVYSGTTASINVKHQLYGGTLMRNEGLKFQRDRAQGLAAMLVLRKILNNVFSGTASPGEAKNCIYHPPSCLHTWCKL